MTCKKKQGDFNFALQSRESDFSRHRARISPTLPSLVSPAIVISFVESDWTRTCNRGFDPVSTDHFMGGDFSTVFTKIVL